MIQEASTFTLEEWLHYYDEICKKLSIDPNSDWKHVNQVNDKLPTEYQAQKIIQDIKDKIAPKVIIFGAGPSLKRDFEYIKSVYNLNTLNVTFIAVDGATTIFRQHRVFPNIVVTDLDGIIPYFDEIATWPTYFFIHIHGDNQAAIKGVLPHVNFNKTVFTTQTREVGSILNFGGFTDGDRALSISLALGFEKILLAGFDLDKGPGSYSKQEKWQKHALRLKEKKLQIAKKLISFLKTKSHKDIILVSDNPIEFRRNIDEFFKG